MPSIYPDQTAFSQNSKASRLIHLTGRVQPFNYRTSPISAMTSSDGTYTDTAIRFMRCSPDADDTLTYMVFAEQRLLAMLRREKHAHAAALSDLCLRCSAVRGNGYFTHIWGFRAANAGESQVV